MLRKEPFHCASPKQREDSELVDNMKLINNIVREHLQKEDLTQWHASTLQNGKPLPYKHSVTNLYWSCSGPLSAIMGLHWSIIGLIHHVYRVIGIIEKSRRRLYEKHGR